MEVLKEQVEKLIYESRYGRAVELVSEVFNLRLNVLSSRYGFMKWDSKNQRHIFKVQLKRGRKSYTFEFGQSIANGSQEPTLYDILTCLQKYDVGSFEDFCGEFGYDKDSRTAERTYKAVVKEFEAMERLFNSDELEVLSYIQ